MFSWLNQYSGALQVIDNFWRHISVLSIYTEIFICAESIDTLVDENVLSVLSEEERDRLLPWKFVGMVYTDGYPTDTLSEKYEFVGYEDNWNGKLTPGKIWNHYVRQPIEE